MNSKKAALPYQRAAIVFSLLLLLGCLTTYFFREHISNFATSSAFSDCTFHTLTGYLCPACGNTRAVLALLHGHPLRSLGYNPMILTLVLALMGLYLELICYAFGKRVRILPRSNALLFTVVGLVLGYDILRNFFPAITLC